MCELLGISCSESVRPIISFKGFRERGNVHKHGWGIGLYPDEDRSALVIKEAIKGNESELSGFLANYKNLSSKIFVSHVRKASQGDPAYKNTHPFLRELNGKEYVFAHNGTIRKYNELTINRFKPTGDTDSEHLFCHLLKILQENLLYSWAEENILELQEHLHRINKLQKDGNKTKLNCLMSDGDFLLCYYDLYGNGNLHWLERPPGYLFEGSMLKDDDFTIEFQVEKNINQCATIIATEKLTDEPNWSRFRTGELRVFRNGKLFYPIRTISEVLSVKDVDVYDSSQWLDQRNEAPMVVGLPKKIREHIGVQIGNEVYVSNLGHKIKLTVYSTDKRLLENGSSPANNPDKHACIPTRARELLHLEQVGFRVGFQEFKKVLSSVKIEKI